MKMKLTDAAVRNIPAPKAGRLEVFDALLSGFGVRITENGTRTFFVGYRVKGDRTYSKRRYTLGGVELYSLAEARQEARGVLLEAKAGIDPQERKKIERVEQARDSFAAVAHEFVERYGKVHQREWKKTQSILKSLRGWESRQVQDITRRDVLAELDRLMDNGSPYQANRTLACLRKFFNWCIERGYITTSPAANIKAPGAEKARSHVLTGDELRAIWEACGVVGYPFGPYVRLLLLTAARRGELINARRADINGDVWKIPQTKNDRPHTLPMTPAALEIIEALPVFEGPFLFTTTGGEIPFAGFSKFKARLDKAAGVTGWRLHDLRRTAATGIAGLGFPPHVVERILNHVRGVISGVAAAYNRHGYENEMRAALEAWSRYVESIVKGKQSGRVVPMVRR